VSSQETQPPVAVIGAGLDLGAGRRGVDMGPSAIRYAGLDERITELGRRCDDWGDVVTAVAEATAVGDEHMRYLAEIKATCERIAALVARAVEEGSLPLVLGGDHSVALGTLGGMARARGQGGVLWFDAHGDLNTVESSPSGNLWGMPLRRLIDSGAVDADDVVLIGARNLDPPEEEFIGSHGIRLGEEGIGGALEGVSCTYVAFDADVLEPSELAVFMPEPGGVSLADGERILAGIAAGARQSTWEHANGRGQFCHDRWS